MKMIIRVHRNSSYDQSKYCCTLLAFRRLARERIRCIEHCLADSSLSVYPVHREESATITPSIPVHQSPRSMNENSLFLASPRGMSSAKIMKKRTAKEP